MKSGQLRQTFWRASEALLPWLALLWILYYTVTFFSVFPYVGFEFGHGDTILVVFLSGSRQNQPQPGDIILQVGAVTRAEIKKDLRVGYMDQFHPGVPVEMVVERQGRKVSFSFTPLGFTTAEFFERLNSQWFVPFIFWVAGVAVLLFLRPRSLMRLLLALFCFLTAAWIAPSNLSAENYEISALMLRVLVWLSVPVYLHLHWLFPTPLRRLPGWAWAAVYAAGVVLAAASWLQWVPQNILALGLLVALAGSLVLLGAHLLFQPSERRALRGLVGALGLALLPVLGAGIQMLLNSRSLYDGMVILGLAALPGFYFFTLYRRQLNPRQAGQASRLVGVYAALLVGTLIFCLVAFPVLSGPGGTQYYLRAGQAAMVMLVVIGLVNFAPFLVLPALADEDTTIDLGAARLSFRANRAAPILIFLSLETFLTLMLTVLLQVNITGASSITLALGILLSGALALVFYPPFKRFFETTVLGMPLTPDALAVAYTGRITTSLERDALERLLLDELLPSLLVRQFAQLEDQNAELKATITLRVLPEALPQLTPVKMEAGAALPEWVRLALPLRAAGRTRGWWLLGRRDPDDHYSAGDIEMLKTLAGQTALALVNIEQAESLHALYRADIDRREVERMHLAAELHDDVLNQFAVLSASLEDASPAALAAYDAAAAHIREIINGLRPPMLNYGLYRALESLVDECNDRLEYENSPRCVRFLVEPCEARYPAHAELNLFRMVQQACGNAMQHSGCQAITIAGVLTEEGADLLVSDDGSGFPAGEGIDLPALLAHRHFGLAGMFERAALIGAELRIESQPGQGSRVRVFWTQRKESGHPASLSSN